MERIRVILHYTIHTQIYTQESEKVDSIISSTYISKTQYGSSINVLDGSFMYTTWIGLHWVFDPSVHFDTFNSVFYPLCFQHTQKILFNLFMFSERQGIFNEKLFLNRSKWQMFFYNFQGTSAT